MPADPQDTPPAPTDTRAMQFWDRVAPKYAALAVRDTESYAEKLKRTRARLTPNMDLLEIGCGTGTTALKLAPNVRHIRATDFSETMLEIARDKAGQAGIENVSFERIDAQLPLSDGPGYDAVLAFNVLHLVPDLDLVLERVASALKPGGLFISSTFCLSDGMSAFRPLAWVGNRLGLLPQLRFLASETLVQKMRDHGLSVEESWKPGRAKSHFMIASKT
ncbi:class I SAM-dependent methyltransferase [Amaricoccus macauensis]|uniref:class I SAM-dependent methyltransferase n=1 Tax=Amaricoccus macauensis TaxID=57001 RepID=UPI003C7CD065